MARLSSLPPELRRLDAALAYVGACLNPVLDRSVVIGRWRPEVAAWGNPHQGAVED